jgi:hypothetical protein
LKLGSGAWQAYSSSNPTEVESLLDSDLSALPFLRSALSKHLQRFPSTRNGLGRVENLVLELVADGRHEFKSLFPEFGKREPVYGFGDAQVFVEMKRLVNAAKALLTMGNGTSAMDAAQITKTSFQVTEHGQEVLHGEEDFVHANGIDLWLGGVHLEGDEAAWRWDESKSKVVRIS